MDEVYNRLFYRRESRSRQKFDNKLGLERAGGFVRAAEEQRKYY